MRYRTLYIEEEARNWPLTQLVLARAEQCPVVHVRHYKDVFNRPRQSSRLQKQNPALILAVNRKPPIYQGPEICQNFGSGRFFYVSLLQNCPYDCSYCFLQGLYPSGDILAFVNVDDYLSGLSQLADGGSAYIALSHDADLLAMHQQLPYLDLMHSFIISHPDLLFEVRSKSASALFFTQQAAVNNLVFAFSLAPQSVIDRYELKTPSLKARLNAATRAISQGHPVRLCFDPIFCDQDSDKIYNEFFKQVFTTLDPAKIRDISYGFFRLPKDIYRRIIKRRPDAPFLAADLQETDGRISLPARRQAECRALHINMLQKWLSNEQIFLVQ